MKQAVVGLMWVGLSTIALGYADHILRMDRVDAQVVPDNTLATTVQTPNNLAFTIEGGTRSGNNLFHSFSQFSVPTGGSAGFNNALDVQNIFARVTGGTASNINGLIQANGSASLFLLNPSGILFGPNASLNLGGSFVGTTASSVKFADGTEFSAVNSGTPLLTISAPIGLQMGANAGPIQVQGAATANPSFRPPTLAVAPMQTLALVGGQIDLSSATISAPGGRIELWALRNGQIATNTQSWQLASPATAATWGTITLQQAALVDASGMTAGGGINVRGRGLTLQESSNMTSFTFSGEGQDITVNTTEFVDLLGATDSNFPFGFDGISTSVGNSFGIVALPGPPATGRAGNVTVETGRLQVANSATLRSATAGNHSSSGNVTVRATDVEMRGFETLPTLTATTIMSVIVAGNNNQSGQVTVEADRVRLLGGSRIAGSVIGGNGKAGDIIIRAAESLEMQGTTFSGLSSSVLTTLEAGSSGQGGNILIDTGLLKLSQGGAIASEVAGSQINPFFGALPGAQGTAGSIDIRAREVQVSDPIVDGYSQTLTGITTSLGNGARGTGGTIHLTADSLRVFNGGQISASSQGQGAAGNVNLDVNSIDVQGGALSQINGQYLPSTITASSSSSAAAGSVNITANSVAVRDAAQVTVSNTGTGDAGNLNINAETVFLNNGASLQAKVNGGNQGNIWLQARDLLLLRQGSQIVTSATGTSTGGNITIDAPIIVGLENSDIIANAVEGRGGNIQITTQGIIGLKYRDRLTPENDITASSEFGVNGTVDVNNVGVDPNSGLVELSTTLIDSNQQVAAACSGTEGSSFVITGRGGIPQNPTQEVSHNRSWNDMRDLSAFHKSAIAQAPTSTPTIVQATDWYRNPQTGKVELTAVRPLPSNAIATCATTPNS
ncbi:S-layer family protein [Leptolyngbya boryana CZ1]|uniref:S-layer family protein n=1 Tax=Leptolyngbya boryana CZ1 TaxID=3060204 RepID=A0AA96WPI1_LEPBY|nr:S-layer family protein [Leptolyngbya boryana]WNZ43680.1 S-layer family protein [Leptolyngbya boryana CZ1]